MFGPDIGGSLMMPFVQVTCRSAHTSKGDRCMQCGCDTHPRQVFAAGMCGSMCVHPELELQHEVPEEHSNGRPHSCCGAPAVAFRTRPAAYSAQGCDQSCFGHSNCQGTRLMLVACARCSVSATVLIAHKTLSRAKRSCFMKALLSSMYHNNNSGQAGCSTK